MTTVAQLIEYLQTLPPETTVQVAAAVEGMYTAWTTEQDLDIPQVAEGLNPADYSSNMMFDHSSGGKPWLLLGSI